jgi:hypothetical protein
MTQVNREPEMTCLHEDYGDRLGSEKSDKMHRWMGCKKPWLLCGCDAAFMVGRNALGMGRKRWKGGCLCVDIARPGLCEIA